MNTGNTDLVKDLGFALVFYSVYITRIDHLLGLYYIRIFLPFLLGIALHVCTYMYKGASPNVPPLEQFQNEGLIWAVEWLCTKLAKFH